MPLAFRLFRAALLVSAMAGVTGCTGLSTLTSVVTEPADLYDLTPKSTYAADLPVIAAQVVVEEPTAASSVNTDRIAVKPNAFQVQYFPKVRWVDRAPLLVQTMLLESFENTGKVAAVGRQAIIGEEPGGPLTILVQLNIKIVQEPRGQIVASSSFQHKELAASDDMSVVVAAFDTALGKTMGQAVDWAIREIARITG